MERGRFRLSANGCYAVSPLSSPQTLSACPERVSSSGRRSPRMASASTTHFLTSPREGISYMTSSKHSSNTVRMLDRVRLRRCGCPEAEAPRAAAYALVDDRVEGLESAAANKEDIRGVYLDEVLVRVLAPALRGNVRHRALDDLEQRLLHTLA